MNTNHTTDAEVVAQQPPIRPKAKKLPKPLRVEDLARQASRDARKSAAVILEVLAGLRLPSEAASALSTSLARYYQLEIRALKGMIEACEPKPKGRAPSLEKEMALIKRENERLKREAERYAALARMNQRAIGIVPAQTALGAKKKGKGRKRTPTTRALKVVEKLSREEPPVQ